MTSNHVSCLHRHSVLIGIILFCLCVGIIPQQSYAQRLAMPYKKQGFTERTAAMHLAQRFTFGVTPALIEEMVSMGLSTWFERQIDGKEREDSLLVRLQQYPALTMTLNEQLQMYKRAGEIYSMAKKEGRIPDSIKAFDAQSAEYKKFVDSYAKEKKIKLIGELQRDLVAQKFMRAVYARNQVREVLTDFWFNHFNVSTSNNEARGFILAYERDAIRPNILESFRLLLSATAKHPAMLLYLNNAQSVANKGIKTFASVKMDKVRASFPLLANNVEKRMQGEEEMDAINQDPEIRQRRKARMGLNENYARELLELHTLGVDGGYTQKDVTEVARALTGWTVIPQRLREKPSDEKQERTLQFMERLGYVMEEHFFFQADGHDAEEKEILGKRFPAGSGIDEGETVLDRVAEHPSTARHIATKLACRFVSDTPPEELVRKLTEVFIATKGDLRAMIIAIVNAQEFWQKEYVNAKIKLPFELAVSAVRVLRAHVIRHGALFAKTTQMGQPVYGCVPPTGFDERSAPWVNTGALVARMNVGVQLSQNTIGGIVWSVDDFLEHREPESSEMAMQYCVAQLLPERSHDGTLQRLRSALNDNEFEKKISDEMRTTETMPSNSSAPTMMAESETPFLDMAQQRLEKRQAFEFAKLTATQKITTRIVGFVLGSPEFQRK